jgi:hypothetical protein
MLSSPFLKSHAPNLAIFTEQEVLHVTNEIVAKFKPVRILSLV